MQSQSMLGITLERALHGKDVLKRGNARGSEEAVLIAAFAFLYCLASTIKIKASAEAAVQPIKKLAMSVAVM